MKTQKTMLVLLYLTLSVVHTTFPGKRKNHNKYVTPSTPVHKYRRNPIKPILRDNKNPRLEYRSENLAQKQNHCTFAAFQQLAKSTNR